MKRELPAMLRRLFFFCVIPRSQFQGSTETPDSVVDTTLLRLPQVRLGQPNIGCEWFHLCHCLGILCCCNGSKVEIYNTHFSSLTDEKFR